MTRPSLEQAIQAVRQLPHMPDTVQQVLACLNDPQSDQSRIEQTIARDSALVAHLLRLANSPFYGLTNQVETIHEAVVVVGLSNLRMIVMITMLTSLKLPQKFDKPTVQALFQHSIAVAICAHVLALNSKVPSDQAFLAGILHDIGKLALMSTYPDIYADVLARQLGEKLSTTVAEREMLGFDHAGIGYALCQQWNLPVHICSAIATHHGPTLDSNVDSVAPLSELLYRANLMAHILDPDTEGQLALPEELVWASSPLRGHQKQLTKDFTEINKMYQQFVVLAP